MIFKLTQLCFQRFDGGANSPNSTEMVFHTDQRPLLTNRKKDAIDILNVDLIN
jgi:hypothetical protein